MKRGEERIDGERERTDENRRREGREMRIGEERGGRRSEERRRG